MEQPQVLRWETLTKKAFDRIDRSEAVVLLTCSPLEDCHSPVWKLRFLFLNPLMIRLSNRLLGFRNPIA